MFVASYTNPLETLSLFIQPEEKVTGMMEHYEMAKKKTEQETKRSTIPSVSIAEKSRVPVPSLHTVRLDGP